MARIRSIKPDFFTSEVIAALPLSARLTFIGLWTYVDDNGVGADNDRLIVASVWPLEDDARATVLRTADDLRLLSGKCLIFRYQHLGRRLLYITSWSEHQKISHPRAPRYPVPTEVPRLSGNPPESSGVPPEFGTQNGNNPAEQRKQEAPEDYQSPPEILRPEQGAGSREQGAGNTRVAVCDSNVEGTPNGLVKIPSEPLGLNSFLSPPEPPATRRGNTETERQRQANALTRWEKGNASAGPA